MTNNYYSNRSKTTGGWIYKLFLYVSFVWVSLYPTTNVLLSSFYFGAGDLLNLRGDAFTSAVMLILSEALFSWFIFEIIFYIYRWFLGFKIYSFIVPAEKLKIESRVFFIYRNVFYGLFLNLCFLYPYLYTFVELASIVITFIVVLSYANHLNKTYAEPIVGHFVFKCFCYPIFIYEAISIISSVVGVL